MMNKIDNDCCEFCGKKAKLQILSDGGRYAWLCEECHIKAMDKLCDEST